MSCVCRHLLSVLFLVEQAHDGTRFFINAMMCVVSISPILVTVGVGEGDGCLRCRLADEKEVTDERVIGSEGRKTVFRLSSQVM